MSALRLMLSYLEEELRRLGAWEAARHLAVAMALLTLDPLVGEVMASPGPHLH
ncbi:hypothetical protein M0638_14065 [Roseomonas sp. NAR14]|uniref:Uncharacterized protein n=1 Tax=Roseomonas acroporae TaxID=2937791 RepID=A0A9X1Y8M8_9PROT|nr:hypothetical protein [Roseomonas acroporae]MCK8785511.1 hypothetical protein [Roseomonas acroporae]